MTTTQMNNRVKNLTNHEVIIIVEGILEKIVEAEDSEKNQKSKRKIYHILLFVSVRNNKAKNRFQCLS